MRTGTRTIAITGATGFVGTGLLARLRDCGSVTVQALVRRADALLPLDVERVLCGNIDGDTDWGRALSDVDAVVHLAARVHVMREMETDPYAAFRRVNVDGTIRLAEQAAAAGVRRFVFLSSIKVNGEGGLYTELDPPMPADAYGVSKAEAEAGLRAVAIRTGLEVVIIRPPLVYGPGVQGNFRSLMRAIERGMPLPLGAVHNKRSLVAVDNLADFIVACLDRPAAANETFLVSDGQDLSTTSLIRRLAAAMRRAPRLLPVPAALLSVAAAVAGKGAVARRLLGSLQVDISKARGVLEWSPPVGVDEALRRTAAAR